MWGRMYPHVVLLIFMDIILKISCQGNGSITFLIDDTSSMDDDIKQVRKSVYRIKDIVLHEKSSLIDNMVLVTFNDPGVLERVVTNDPNKFKKALDEIRVHNEAKRPYLDCWEPAMKGLLLALKKSKNNSYIFVFTDAPAKDYIDSQSVIEMCQQKQTQIIFVLTGTLCSKFTYVPAAIDSYFDIATACSGLAIFVNKNEVDKVFGPIEEIIKGNKTVITTATIPAGVSKIIPFTIDGHTDYVIIYSSGKNVSLKINQRSISSKAIMWTDNVKVLKLTNIRPGTYSVTVKGSSRTTIAIVGRTDFFFNHGFSESKPKSLSDTLPQPMSDDTKLYLSVSITDDEHSVKIVSAQFLDMNEKPILNKMPLSEISKDFYVTDPFIAPSQRFKVAVNGVVKATGQPITRISKIPVTPPPPKVAPKVQGISTIKVNKGETVQIECKVVRGFPAPKITWLFEDKSSSTFTPIPKVSDTVLVINNVEGKDDGKYKCKAENVKGKDELVTTLYVQDPPKIVSSVSTAYEGTEGDASLKIPCDATGSPKPSITWKLNDRVINQNPKYSIENGTLIIRDPKLSDKNSYKCEAKNEIGTDSAIFKTYIYQKPKVLGVAAKQVRLGWSARIECTVTKGEPKPTITWHFMDNAGLKFLKIDGSEKVLHISKAENKHAGSYKCVAENKVGTDEHITKLEVQDIPRILSSVTTVYQSTEGEALLKIPCVTTGVPKPSITWKLNDGVINPSTKYSIVDGTLIIKDPKLSDSNSYTCEARNVLGAVSAIFKTYIRQKPQVSGIRAKQVKVGASASIECTIIKGEPKPTITWHFMDYSSIKFVSIAGSDKVLHISRVEHKHAGLYKCVAQNSVGSDEHNTTLEVQEAPQVTGVAVKKVTIGSPTSIECTVVKGEPKPTITWQFMNAFSTEFGSIAGSDQELHISRVESKHAGRYRCVAQNSVGSDEHVTTLVVQELPEIVSSVSTIQSTEGDALMRIPCIATGLPKPSIYWKLDGHVINPSKKYSVDDGTLIIRDPKVSDTNSYTCVAKNEVGAVSATIKTYIRQKPQVSGDSVKQAIIGTAASIECKVNKGEPKPTITWQFMNKLSSKFLTTPGSERVLYISRVELKDAGLYKCVAQNSVGSAEHITTLEVQEAPQVTGVAVKKVIIGSPTSIKCTVVKGEPKPTITWQFMNAFSTEFGSIAGSDQELHISRVESKHAGRYRCVAQNSVGSDEHVTTLVVQELPEIVSSVSTIQSTEGDALMRIPCTATGLPKPSIYWMLDGHVINPSKKYSVDDGTLIIRDPKVSDTNSYTCVAKNEVGAVSATIKTYIRQKPQVSGDSVKQAIIGTAASIECKVNKGEPKPTITWQFMNKLSSKFLATPGTERVLYISRVELKDAGLYKCVAQNSVGSDEHITTLEVQEAPQVTGVAVKKVTIGSPTSIECTVVKGEPKPTITWQFMNAFSTEFGSIAGSDQELHISRVESKHAGRYKCVAQNSVGSDEHVTTLVVQGLPEIVSSVSTIQSTEGDDLMRIPCTATGLPKPSIYWKLDGHVINPSKKYSVDDGTLIIRDPKVSDTNSYTCVAKNEVGAVSATIKTYIRQKPQVSGDSVKQAIIGTAASIECKVNKGEPKPTITWLFMNKLSSKFLATPGTERVLYISSVELKDAGLYKCVAQNSVGSDEHITTLEVQDLPKIFSNVSTIYQSTEGDVLMRIPCIATGLPKPSIIWKLDGRVINPSEKYSVDDGTLIIREPKVSDPKSYTCEAKNEVGAVSATIKTYIRQKPQVSGDSVKQAIIGTAASIECKVNKGEPKPTITWQFMNNLSLKFITTPGSERVLNISRVDLKHAGRYKCVAKNSVGSDEHITKLEVQEAPQVTGDASKKVRIGSSTSIECMVVKGVPKPTMSWQFMDDSSPKFISIAGSDKELNISRVEHKHAGRYKCVAQNRVGIDEHITTLVLQDPPTIVSSGSNNYQSIEGDALLRIPCAATGLPKPSITWKLNDRIINTSEKFSIEDGTLIIRSPKVSDTNSYTCEAKNEVGADSAIFKTYIRQVPIIIGVLAAKVRIGSEVKILCTVKGEPKPTIKWQYMDNFSSKFLSISGSDEALLISKVESKHAGRYKCIAQNNVGSNEHVTRLEVQDMPKIISSVSTTIQSTEGDALLRIPCDAVGLPAPSITWKLDGLVIKPSAKYFIDNGTLIIRDPKVSDTNSYTCEAKNEVGAVSAIFKAYIRQIPKLKGVVSKNIRIGNPVNIECIIDQGEPTPKISWQFMDKNALNFVPVAGSENILHISKAENKHAGRYKCVAQNIIGSDEHVTMLIVEYVPGITINSTTIEGILGDLALRIPCKVVGVPQPVITWKKNGNAIISNEKYSIEDGALVIVKPTESDSSSYTCEAKNSVGSTNNTFQATVRRNPKNFGTEHYVYLKVGETKKIECEAYTSESQSMKWFETKIVWLRSTTSSPLDSQETTTALISPDVSLTPRTNELNNKEPYIQIANASPSDHDGNYTCHVSDKHGNTQTHTYVVDVGIAPKFSSEDNSLSNWRGDLTDIIQYCDIESDAKPTPVVQWTFNGKVLTDLSLAGVGYYTCNVSNVHGYVLKRFDVKSSACLLNRNLQNAPYTPLVLNGEGFWNKLETKKYYTIVEQEVKITLSCPSRKDTSNSFKIFPNESTIEAHCYKGDSFIIDNKTYKLSDLQCTNSIQPSVIKKKVKCSTETSELIRVGYYVPSFLEAYEVCFDHKTNMPLYTRIIMTETNNNGASSGYNWYTYPGIGSEKTERGFTCKNASSSCCYSKSQLVNAIDFNDGPAKKSTFIDPLNVIPVWIPCDTSKSSWEDVNDMVRSQLSTYIDIVVWSGTHTLQEKYGAVIPRYLWKVVRLDYEEVMAIVHVNDPNPTKSDIKCKSPDTCDKYEDWFKSDDSTYCCSLPDFLKSFGIQGTDIGEFNDTAMDKIDTV